MRLQTIYNDIDHSIDCTRQVHLKCHHDYIHMASNRAPSPTRVNNSDPYTFHIDYRAQSLCKDKQFWLRASLYYNLESLPWYRPDGMCTARTLDNCTTQRRTQSIFRLQNYSYNYICPYSDRTIDLWCQLRHTRIQCIQDICNSRVRTCRSEDHCGLFCSYIEAACRNRSNLDLSSRPCRIRMLFVKIENKKFH